ncbi:unnamed protein product, partial [Ixodes pacificus]
HVYPHSRHSPRCLREPTKDQLRSLLTWKATEASTPAAASWKRSLLSTLQVDPWSVGHPYLLEWWVQVSPRERWLPFFRRRTVRFPSRGAVLFGCVRKAGPCTPSCSLR